MISLVIKKLLKERAAPYFIEIDDVSMIDLSFTKKFLAAVETKQVALQEAERARFLVEQAMYEKKYTIVKAEGESKSAEIMGKTMNPTYVELKRIEGSKRIAEIISEAPNKAFIDADTLLMNFTAPVFERLTKLNGFDKVKT